MLFIVDHTHTSDIPSYRVVESAVAEYKLCELNGPFLSKRFSLIVVSEDRRPWVNPVTPRNTQELSSDTTSVTNQFRTALRFPAEMLLLAILNNSSQRRGTTGKMLVVAFQGPALPGY